MKGLLALREQDILIGTDKARPGAVYLPIMVPVRCFLEALDSPPCFEW
jgi:hypothetical protein